MEFKFSSAYRLKRGWQFDVVFRTGRRETGALVRLLFITGQEGHAQVGVTVAKKIAGAVARARGRRVMREAMRRFLPYINDGVWVVASLRDRGLDAKAYEIYEDIRHLLVKRNLLTERHDWDIDLNQ